MPGTGPGGDIPGRWRRRRRSRPASRPLAAVLGRGRGAASRTGAFPRAGTRRDYGWSRAGRFPGRARARCGAAARRIDAAGGRQLIRRRFQREHAGRFTGRPRHRRPLAVVDLVEEHELAWAELATDDGLEALLVDAAQLLHGTRYCSIAAVPMSWRTRVSRSSNERGVVMRIGWPSNGGGGGQGFGHARHPSGHRGRRFGTPARRELGDRRRVWPDERCAWSRTLGLWLLRRCGRLRSARARLLARRLGR